jgi:hypothetical protein
VEAQTSKLRTQNWTTTWMMQLLIFIFVFKARVRPFNTSTWRQDEVIVVVVEVVPAQTFAK